MPVDRDDELDLLLAECAPRAPVGFAARVQVRVESRARLRRFAAVAGAVMIAAAAALLLMMRLKPAPAPEPWRVARVEGSVDRRVGEPIDGLHSLLVEKHGRAELRRGAWRGSVTPWPDDAWADVRASHDELSVYQGAVALGGDGANITTEVGRVIALGDGAEVSLTVTRRPIMSLQKIRSLGGVVAATVLVSVYVLHGRARVEASPPSGGAIVLGEGDRALASSTAPPVVLRHAAATHAPASSIAPAPPPARAPAPTVPVEKSPAAAPAAAPRDDQPATGTLDKESIRATIQSIIPGIKDCYEAALVDHPNLSGRVVIKMRIRARGGRGKVDDAEVDYDEHAEADLNSPATEQCLLERLAAAEFEAPAGGDVMVRYPFVLMPPDPE
jgi:hypothetical protein